MMNRRLFLAGALATVLTAATASEASAATTTKAISPKLLHSLKPATGAVMQDFAIASGYYFITQATSGSTPNTESTVVTKLNIETGKREKMTLVDGGHGIGINAKIVDGKSYLFYSWGYHTHMRVPFTVGTFTFEQARRLKGAVVYRVQNPTGGEMLVKYDWKSDTMVCCEAAGANDIFYRRKISEFQSGIDKRYNAITLSMGGDGTLQGFTTINNTFYRWLGSGADGNVMKNANDTIVLEAFDWKTGKRISRRTYNTLGSSKGKWADGRCEPEGATVIREKNGKASLVVGLNTGAYGTGNRQWLTYKFENIG